MTAFYTIRRGVQLTENVPNDILNALNKREQFSIVWEVRK